MSGIINLYFDDTGSRRPDHKAVERSDGMDHFGLGGCLVDEQDVETFWAAHKTFMERWGLDCPLHSTRIRTQQKTFAWLGRDAERKKAFLDELGELILSLPYVAVACIIDRKGYNARYADRYDGKPWMLCKTAYSILVERSAKFARAQGKKLQVFFEESGPTEDRDILAYHRALKTTGMPFATDTSAQYAGLQPEDFSEIILGDPLRRTKKVPMLQIADLVLYAIAKAGYDPQYAPYLMLQEHRKLLDCYLAPEELAQLGIKYSCFEIVQQAR